MKSLSRHPKRFAVLCGFMNDLTREEWTALGVSREAQTAQAALLELTNQGVLQPRHSRSVLALMRHAPEWRALVEDCFPAPAASQAPLARLIPAAEGRRAAPFIETHLRKDWPKIRQYFALKRLLKTCSVPDDPIQLLKKCPAAAALVRLAIAKQLPKSSFYLVSALDEARQLGAAVDAILAGKTIRQMLGIKSAIEMIRLVGYGQQQAWLRGLARAEAGGPLRQLFLDETAHAMDECGMRYFFVSGQQAVRMLRYQPLPRAPRTPTLSAQLQAPALPAARLVEALTRYYGSSTILKGRLYEGDFDLDHRLRALVKRCHATRNEVQALFTALTAPGGVR